jgi:hypothetical protein
MSDIIPCACGERSREGRGITVPTSINTDATAAPAIEGSNPTMEPTSDPGPPQPPSGSQAAANHNALRVASTCTFGCWFRLGGRPDEGMNKPDGIKPPCRSVCNQKVVRTIARRGPIAGRCVSRKIEW